MRSITITIFLIILALTVVALGFYAREFVIWWTAIDELAKTLT